MNNTSDPQSIENIEQEIDAIFDLYSWEKDRQAIFSLVNDQLALIHQRAQGLLTLAGVVITVTGFSGRIIADTNDLAQFLIVGGIAFVAISAAINMAKVLPVRWVTSYLHLPPREWLALALKRRNAKTKAFKYALFFMVIGMLLYLGSISLMLLYPELTELEQVR